MNPQRSCRIAALALLGLALLVSLALAQESVPWPSWVFGGELGYAHWPAGEYPVWWPNFSGTEQGTLTVLDDGSWAYGGGAGWPQVLSVGCSAPNCETLVISFYLTGNGGSAGLETWGWFEIHWDEWSTLSLATPETGTPQPTTTATPRFPTPGPTPTPAPGDNCPADTIQQQAPRVEFLQVYPPYPVVVGQGGQGLRLTVRVTSYPVVHRYWTHQVRDENHCVHVETGFISPTGQECVDRWPGWEYRNVHEEWCQEHLEIIPDPIAAGAFQAHARLRENSKRWIRTTLAQHYPGARVRHPDWDVAGQGSGGCLPDGRCILNTQAVFPFEDPGWYDLWVDGWTVGTTYTPPRVYRLEMEDPQPVYLLDTTLISD